MVNIGKFMQIGNMSINLPLQQCTCLLMFKQHVHCMTK